MAQKIIQIGSSAGITLSNHILELLDVTIGDSITLDVNTKTKRVSIIPMRRKEAEEMFDTDQELLAWSEKFVERYGEMLKELSDK